MAQSHQNTDTPAELMKYARQKNQFNFVDWTSLIAGVGFTAAGSADINNSGLKRVGSGYLPYAELAAGLSFLSAFALKTMQVRAFKNFEEEIRLGKPSSKTIVDFL